MIRVQQEAFDPGEELAAFTRRQAEAGAVVSFVGLVRSDDGDVAELHLQHYPSFTERELAAIAAEAQRRFAITEPLVIHRFGTLQPGEPIVFVAAAARHRRPAFEAADYLMDRLKTDAPFWKQERGSFGQRWIEPRGSDHVDAQRWKDETRHVAD